VSIQSRQGRAGRARWTLASVTAAALVLGLSACNGDSDDEELSQAEADLSSAQDDLAAAESSLDDANSTISDQEQQISDLNGQLETANQAASDAQAQLDSEKERADQAESDLADLQAQIELVAANFPVTVPATLEPFTDDLVGGYTMTLSEAFCDGIATCGQERPEVHADIVLGENGLELQVPTVFITGLFMVEGSLFGVTDSNLIVGPCADGTETNSQVSTTIFANGITVDTDGTQTLAGLGASVFVAVNPAGSCGAGNVFFAATLTPD
jgi:hypothetical protein